MCENDRQPPHAAAVAVVGTPFFIFGFVAWPTGPWTTFVKLASKLSDGGPEAAAWAGNLSKNDRGPVFALELHAILGTPSKIQGPGPISWI